MKKTKFTEEQIVFALQQHKAGGNSDRRNVICKLGVSEQITIRRPSFN